MFIVQLDQAGGHGGGQANMSPMLSELNEFGSKEEKKIKFVAQCSK